MRKMTQEALKKLDDLLGFMQRSDWWTLDADNVEYDSYAFSKHDISIARDVLRKLPQVESIAMNGGWVLDCGNVWCKSGDSVKFYHTASGELRSGVLEFSTDFFAWQIVQGTTHIPLGDVYEWHKL